MKTLFASTIAALLVFACGGPAAAPAAAPTATHQHATSTPAAAQSAPASATALATAPAAPSVSAAAPAAAPSSAPSLPAPAAAAPAATAPAAPAATAPAPTAVPTEPAKPVPTITPAPSAPLSTPTAKTTIAVTLTDAMTIVVGQTSAPAGTVTFTVKNSGSVPHDLIVLKTSLAQNQIPADPTQPALALTPGLVGQAASLAPGASTALTLTLGAGSYVLLCNQPAHYIAGMHIGFTVTGPLARVDPEAPYVLA